jgi:anti-sigma factor RsiW
MLCSEFEDRLTDYLDGALAPTEQTACAEHALACPVCHDLLNEVKNTLRAVQMAEAPAPPSGLSALEARILAQTAPEAAMTCAEFENYLTDYLDGFLPAALYHRWERHAALCAECGDLPGLVVRSIGACSTFAQDELELPVGLHERILQATLGKATAENRRAAFTARLAALMRGWLDAMVTPQMATVATMLLVAVLVGTSTLSDDGSIGGMYRASLRLAEQTYENGAGAIIKSSELPDDLHKAAGEIENFVDKEKTHPMEMRMQAAPAASNAQTARPTPERETKTETHAPAAKQNANHASPFKKR